MHGASGATKQNALAANVGLCSAVGSCGGAGCCGGLCMVVIGIDPDMIASGVAVIYGPENLRKIHSLNSVKLFALADFVKSVGRVQDVIVKIEDVEANKGLFASRQNNNKAVSIKIAMSVGKVQATTHHIRELLESAGYTVKMVTPLKGAVKQQAKKDAEYFNKLTGWSGRSNADQRDAALIALYG